MHLWQIAAKSGKISTIRTPSKGGKWHTATDDSLYFIDLDGGIGDCQLRERHN
jgi:hypothetical protein